MEGMGGSCGTNEGEEKFMQCFGEESLRGLAIDERTKLKWFIKKVTLE